MHYFADHNDVIRLFYHRTAFKIYDWYHRVKSNYLGADCLSRPHLCDSGFTVTFNITSKSNQIFRYLVEIIFFLLFNFSVIVRIFVSKLYLTNKPEQSQSTEIFLKLNSLFEVFFQLYVM